MESQLITFLKYLYCRLWLQHMNTIFFSFKLCTHTIKTKKNSVKNNKKYNELNIYLNPPFRVNAAQTFINIIFISGY